MRALTCPAGEGVDEVSANKAANETDDGSNRDGSRRLAERDTADEDDRLHTLTQNGDEGQDEEHVLPGARTLVVSCETLQGK